MFLATSNPFNPFFLPTSFILFKTSALTFSFEQIEGKSPYIPKFLAISSNIFLFAPIITTAKLSVDSP